MSGIFGKVGGKPPKPIDLECMSKAIAHRGPDNQGIYTGDGIGLGCRHLSVKNLYGGRPPFSNVDESIWVVLDGVLYNPDNLRRELERDDRHKLRGQSDEELIAHLYEDFGPQCLERIRGMFAFALWDRRRQQLLLARDHIGQKPIFYTHFGQSLYFASEVKGVTAALSATPKLDYTSLYHYLSLRFIPAPGTMLQNIKKLPPAHFLIYNNDTVRVSRYWRPSFLKKVEMNEESYIEGLKEKLHETVAAHLVGDVPVGAFLSGGLDSSLIVCMMAQSIQEPFSTFSVGAAEKEFDELPYARMVSDACGTHQFETLAEEDLIRSLPLIIHHIDEPSDPVAASKFVGSRLASKHVKVVLGGDGGDELFAGFDRYQGIRLIGYYAGIPAVIRKNLIAKLAELIPANFGYDSIIQKFQWVNQVADVSGLANRFNEAVSFFRFNYDNKKSLLTDYGWQQVENMDTCSVLREKLDECDAQEIIEKMLYTDYTTRLPEHSLMLTDRIGMAHGVEVRSPLVDKELVEYIATFPLRMKIRGRKSKYAERKLAERLLPIAIAKRKKRGFRFPLAFWFGNQLYPFLRNIFADSHLVNDGIFRGEYIYQLLNEHRRRHIDNNVRIWMLLNLEIWYRLAIERQPQETLDEWIGIHLERK